MFTKHVHPKTLRFDLNSRSLFHRIGFDLQAGMLREPDLDLDELPCFRTGRFLES